MRLIRTIGYSLSARLFLLFFITGLLISWVIAGAFKHGVWEDLKNYIHPHISQYIHYVQEDIGYPHDIQKAKQLSQRLPIQIHIKGPNLLWSSAGKPFDFSHLHFHHVHHHPLQIATDGETFLVKSHRQNYTIYFSIPHKHKSPKTRIIRLLAIIAVLSLLYLCYRIVRLLFSPIRAIQQGVNQIGQGRLDTRIQTRRKDELGDLINHINCMTQDIEKLLDAKHQLLLAISHELRSPLTRTKVNLALLEDSSLKSNINDDIVEMEQLISELLEAEKLNDRHVKLQKTQFGINEFVEEIIHEYFKEQSINLSLLTKEQNIVADMSRCKFLLKNILDNAIRYNEGTQAVELGLYISENNLQVKVKNYGPGIDAKHLPHLFEPFYRIDSSRQRKTGGYGLGLYLCRLIVQAHGGNIKINSQREQYTEVLCELPGLEINL